MRIRRLAEPLVPVIAACGLAFLAIHCGPSAPEPTTAVAPPTSTTTPVATTTVPEPPTTAPSTVTSASVEKPVEKPHWGYHGEHGPNHWGDLSPEWSLCKTGTSQTPIDIVVKDAVKSKDLKPLELAYKPLPLTVQNNGHTVVVNAPAGNTLGAAGDKWELAQFHFHSPSEHMVDGKPMDAELHLVHKNAKGELAVVGVLLKKGKENKALAAVFDNLPEPPEKGADPAAPKAIEGKTIDLMPLLPKKAGYYSYSGSLTTPPCTENVSWIVLAPTAEISEAQLDKFKKATHGDTNRPIQPMGSRKVASFK
jgi:carbonic anhydrase